MNLWAFCDSQQLVIVDAETAREAFEKAGKFWYPLQTITPLGVLPLDAPDLINKPIYKFDREFFWKGFDYFFELLK